MTKRCYLTNLILPLLLLCCFGTANAETPKQHQSVGLVLSGGGAKGIAHIGVIKALEDNNIPIDYVAGTSMGSIVGGLYACGYTTEEMMQLILSDGFGYWSTGTTDPRLSFYLNRARQTPAFTSISLGQKDGLNNSVPQSLISPLPMNFAFMELFSPFTAQTSGDFNRLMVPFRCVASDVAAKHKVVLSKGSVGDAIRASMSFPAVFQATEVDGALLYDGGIYDNFPVDVMRSVFAPSIMIGVDVSTEETGPQTSIIDQLSNMIIQNNDYSLPADEGIKIRIDLNEFSLLDFPKAQQIYQIGYDHGMAMIDSIKSRIETRSNPTQVKLRRDVFKSKTPYLRFDSVKVSGGSKRQNAFISYIFNRMSDKDTLTIDGARKAYYMALSTGKLRNLGVSAHYDGLNDMFTLDVDASVKDDFRAAFGGYLTSSNNSYLFLSAGYSTLSFNSISANVNAWIGQSEMAATANGEIYLRTAAPSKFGIQAVVSRHKYYENDYLFYESKVPTFITEHQYFGRLNWSIAAGYLGKVEIGAGFGHLSDSFFRDNQYESYLKGRINARHNLGQLYASYETSTLDDINFPTKGYYYSVRGMAMSGHFDLDSNDSDISGEHSRPKWVQAEIRTRNYFDISRKFAFGIESDIYLSTRKLYDNYSASIICAPAYAPTPAANHSFNPAFRANNFAALTAVPIYRYNDRLSGRLSISGFMPFRKILQLPDGSAEYGRRFSHPEFFGELDITYHFPFATLAAYANYASYPAHNWNVGLSFGIYLQTPNFLR